MVSFTSCYHRYFEYELVYSGIKFVECCAAKAADWTNQAEPERLIIPCIPEMQNAYSPGIER